MSAMGDIGLRARAAAAALAITPTKTKDAALAAIADALVARADEIVDANEEDLRAARAQGITGALIDRLTLTDERIKDIAHAAREVVDLDDPVGDVMGSWTRPNGLRIEQVRVPMGVVGIIYEARPNVTVDAATLTLKSGNACILRGSSNAIRSNTILTKIIDDACVSVGLPGGCVQLIEDASRESAKELMRARQWVDVLIPRGGADLIRTVVEESTVPVIETGVGNCHVYVDEDANLSKALGIVVNAKVQRPGVCNAAETLLVHRNAAEPFLGKAIAALRDNGVTLRADDATRSFDPTLDAATEDDWYAEYLDLIMAVKVVGSLDDAIAHINRYGTKHTEAIVTENAQSADRFVNEVDAACVVVNASTRFADGGEFGFGAEIGISNQKLHARGPMALRELTSYKYVVRGDGQVRT
ncbi:MAG: glutamate-5-semialdehyde dehydrogenase [Actinomycetota bacterium]